MYVGIKSVFIYFHSKGDWEQISKGLSPYGIIISSEINIILNLLKAQIIDIDKKIVINKNLIKIFFRI